MTYEPPYNTAAIDPEKAADESGVDRRIVRRIIIAEQHRKMPPGSAYTRGAPLSE